MDEVFRKYDSRDKDYRRDGIVVGVSALQSVDLDLISQVDNTKRIEKMVFTAFLLGAQHKKGIV